MFFLIFLSTQVLSQQSTTDEGELGLSSTDAGSAEITGSSFEETASFDSTGDSIEASGSNDDDEEGSLDDSDETESNNDIDADSLEDDDEEEEDECLGLSSSECQEETDDDTGDAECAFNAIEEECYSIVRRAGLMGEGTYDDGFIAAQSAAKQQNDALLTVVGVLAGIIGALVIVIGAGGYYFYQKSQKDSVIRQTSEFVDADEAMGQGTHQEIEAPMISQQ